MADFMELQTRGIELHLVSDAPAEITLAQSLLDECNPRWMRVDGERIVFTLTNGTWEYRITRYDPLLRVVTAELVAQPPCDDPVCATLLPMQSCDTCGRYVR